MTKKWILTVYWSSGKVSTTFQFDSFKAVATLINASSEVSNITGLPLIDKYKLKYMEVV